MNGPGTWAYYRHMLGGGEVIIAWAMLPFHADTLVPALELGCWLGAGLGTMLLARALGAKEPYASTAGAFVLAVPALRLMPGSLYVEPLLLAAFSSGLALAVTAVARRSPALVVPSAALLGVAAATKISMLPVTAMPLLLTMIWLPETRVRRAAWSGAAIVVYAMAVGPWLVRAWLDTGAPFSPFPVVVAGWTAGIAPPEVLYYLTQPDEVIMQAASELDVLRQVFSEPHHGVEGLGVLTLVVVPGLLAGIVFLAWRSRRELAIILAAGVSCLVTYYTPGFFLVRHMFPVNSSRFLLPAVVVAAAGSVVWSRGHPTPARLFRRLLLGTAFWHLLSYAWVGTTDLSRVGALRAGLIAIGLVEGWRLLGCIQRSQPRRAARLAVAIAAIALVVSWRDTHRYELWEADYTLHPFGAAQYWPSVAAELDTPQMPRRIAVTSGPERRLDNWFVYPFMGRRLQNEVLYVPLSSDRRVHHFGEPDDNRRYAEVADYDIWKGQIMLQGVTDVVSFVPRSIELTWMEQHPEHFQHVSGYPGFWGVYHVAGR